MYKIYKNQISPENLLCSVKYPSQLGDLISAFLHYEPIILVGYDAK